MGFKRINYDSGENFVEVKIKEGRDKIVDTWIFMMSDLPKWYNIIGRKYGIDSKKPQRDLEWVR